MGHATPEGAAALVGFLAEFVARENPTVRIDWHGHQDRGLAVANSLAALRAGAHRVHGCGLGLGERVGNAPMDQILVNLRLLGWIDRDLSALAEYVQQGRGLRPRSRSRTAIRSSDATRSAPGRAATPPRS